MKRNSIASQAARTIAKELGQNPDHPGTARLAADLGAKPTATLVNTRMEIPWVDACYVVRPDGTKEFPPVRIREAWSRCASEGWAFKVVSESEYKEQNVSNAATHTPGPWHVNGYGYRKNDASPTGREVYICGPDSGLAEGFTVNAANVEVCRIDRHTRGADARLIAAAPELLQVCQALAARHRGEWDHPALVAMGVLRIDSPNQNYEWLVEVIAKATKGGGEK